MQKVTHGRIHPHPPTYPLLPNSSCTTETPTHPSQPPHPASQLDATHPILSLYSRTDRTPTSTHALAVLSTFTTNSPPSHPSIQNPPPPFINIHTHTLHNPTLPTSWVTTRLAHRICTQTKTHPAAPPQQTTVTHSKPPPPTPPP